MCEVWVLMYLGMVFEAYGCTLYTAEREECEDPGGLYFP